MIALIKTTDPTDMILEPFPAWIDPIAFCIFDCYGYSYCENYTPKEELTIYDFEFYTVDIINPFKETEDDPDIVKQRLAVMKE